MAEGRALVSNRLRFCNALWRSFENSGAIHRGTEGGRLTAPVPTAFKTRNGRKLVVSHDGVLRRLSPAPIALCATLFEVRYALSLEHYIR